MKSSTTRMRRERLSPPSILSGPSFWNMTSPMRSFRHPQEQNKAKPISTHKIMVSPKVTPTLSSASPQKSQERDSSRLGTLGVLRGTKDPGVTAAQSGTMSLKM